MDPYNTLERPVLNESDPLQLSFGLTLMQIIDVVSTSYTLHYLLLINYDTMNIWYLGIKIVYQFQIAAIFIAVHLTNSI